MVAVEEFEKTGLGTGGPFYTPEAEGFDAVFEFFQIEDEIVGPEGGAFSDCRGLGGLEVSEAETGERTVLDCEPGEAVNDPDEARAEEFEAFTDEEEVSVVGDETTGGSEVDDAFG